MTTTKVTDAEALAWIKRHEPVRESQADLARAFGWDKVRISRRLRAWEEAGLIARVDGAITTAGSVHPANLQAMTIVDHSSPPDRAS